MFLKAVQLVGMVDHHGYTAWPECSADAGQPFDVRWSQGNAIKDVDLRSLGLVVQQ